MQQFSSVFVLGDTHGSLKEMAKWNKENKNALLIHVGDIGLNLSYLTNVADKLGENNNSMFVVAGNHDASELFDGRYLGKENSVKLLTKYAEETINGEQYVFVGGAISLDRHYRRQFKLLNPDKENWLREDEAVQYNKEIERLEQVDVLVAHTGPRRLVPKLNPFFLQAFTKDDPALIADLDRENEIMEQYYNTAKARGLQDYFFGHFHQHNVMYEGDTKICLLNIDELYQIS